jgi:hypothetical protein
MCNNFRNDSFCNEQFVTGFYFRDVAVVLSMLVIDGMLYHRLLLRFVWKGVPLN